jgi:hypothetical protein
LRVVFAYSVRLSHVEFPAASNSPSFCNRLRE